MNSSLLGNTLNEDNYSDYIEKIINIFRLSSKESSILFDLKLKDYKCTIKLSIVGQNGEKEEFCDTTLKCDEVFYKDFLDVLVANFIDNVEVVTRDIVDLDDDPSLVTLRLITLNNDLFSIDGLSNDHAKKLLSLNENVENKNNNKYLSVSSNAGIANIYLFLLIIIVIIIFFVLMFLFLK